MTCSPTRSMLLSGTDSHLAGLGFALSGNVFEQFHNNLRLLLTDRLEVKQAIATLTPKP